MEYKSFACSRDGPFDEASWMSIDDNGMSLQQLD